MIVMIGCINALLKKNVIGYFSGVIDSELSLVFTFPMRSDSLC